MTWTHFIALTPIRDPLARTFYAEMSRIERWSVRTLRSRIDGMLFERTALSRKPATLAERELKALREDDALTPDLVFRDPYVLDFLGLADTYSEKDLEAAILSGDRVVPARAGCGIRLRRRTQPGCAAATSFAPSTASRSIGPPRPG